MANKTILLNKLLLLHKEYGSNDIFYVNIYSTMYRYALSENIPYNMCIHIELMSMIDS